MDLYRQTILGWWWLIIRALLPTLGIIAIFQHVPAFKPEGLPYGLYVISGMLLWTTLSTTLLRSTRALRRTQSLQTKLAIPKMVYVLASAAIPLVFFGIFAAVLILGIVYEYLSSGVMYLKFGWNLLLLPVPFILVFLLCIGITSFTSVALLFARDARFVLPLVTQLWFYFTPIIYTIDIMPPSWQFVIMHVNPISPLLEMLRWSLFGVGSWDMTSLAISAVVCLTVFLLGARFLMRTEWVLRELM
jgi:lipopolysaccharide transport system permease protein